MSRGEIEAHLANLDVPVYVNNTMLDIEARRVPQADVNHTLDKVREELRQVDLSIKRAGYRGTFREFKEANDWRQDLYDRTLDVLEQAVNRAQWKI